MIFITKFRTNDLQPSKGKQIEFNSGVASSFFNFTEDEYSVELLCKSLADESISKRIKATIKLSPSRGDYKIYQNADGSEDLKDFFLDTLSLDDSNLKDYYAIRTTKSSSVFELFYVPSDSLFSKFFTILSSDRIIFEEDLLEHSDKLDKTDSLELLHALRTKPFAILAGISGTGKSRKVRELAYLSCPKELRGEEGQAPGNYCMIEVKPNWHDSTELLGYYSVIEKKYMVSNFVKFIIKAHANPDVPFFVCLDEMNLAPVEQYFAEYLSVLETRRYRDDANPSKGIITDPLIKKDDLLKHDPMTDDQPVDDSTPAKTKDQKEADWKNSFVGQLNVDKREAIFNLLQTEGLTLPSNLIVVGTVNMDDTTYQFSRKVIDRAMTIEMEGGNLEDMFKGNNDLAYPAEPLPYGLFVPRYVKASDITDHAYADFKERIIGETTWSDDADQNGLVTYLNEINRILSNTPFGVSYRVLNETSIYLGVLLDDAKREEKEIEDVITESITKAVDNVMLMKILPRIEGDADVFKKEGVFSMENNKLTDLKHFCESNGLMHSAEKLKDMCYRLSSDFTRFWP